MATITEVKAATKVEQPEDDPVPVAFTSVTRVCGVCALQFSKYKCPKCSVQTCGLMCYRAHSERCTESFYEAQASDELRATKSSATVRREMLATLARNDEWALRGGPKAGEEDASEEEAEETARGEEEGEEEEVEEGEETEDERVARLTAMLERGGALSEEDLTPAERRAFRRQVADGSLGAALTLPPVWWTLVPPGALEPCARAAGWRYRSEELTAAAAAAGAPLAPQGLPALATLTSRPVPAALRFTVLEAVLSYTYCYRLFCGAPDDDAAEAAEAALALSCALRGTLSGAHASAEEALLRVAEAADAAPSVRTSAQFGAACVRDCEALCSDGGHVALAMGALSSLLAAAARAVRASARQETRGGGGSGGGSGGGNGSRSGREGAGGASGGAAASKAALQHAQRKVTFLQVRRPHHALASTAPILGPLARLRGRGGRRLSSPYRPEVAHYHPHAGVVGVAAARGASRRVRRAPVRAALRAGEARGDAPRVGGRWRRGWRGRGGSRVRVVRGRVRTS